MRTIAWSGLAISVVGAGHDFVSAYQMIYSMDGMMGAANRYPTGVGLLPLGLAVLGTGVAGVRPGAVERMRILGLPMEVYGVLMGVATRTRRG